MAFWPAPKFEGLDQYDQKAGVANAQIEHNLTNASVARQQEARAQQMAPGALDLQQAQAAEARARVEQIQAATAKQRMIQDALQQLGPNPDPQKLRYVANRLQWAEGIKEADRLDALQANKQGIQTMGGAPGMTVEGASEAPNQMGPGAPVDIPPRPGMFESLHDSPYVGKEAKALTMLAQSGAPGLKAQDIESWGKFLQGKHQTAVEAATKRAEDNAGRKELAGVVAANRPERQEPAGIVRTDEQGNETLINSRTGETIKVLGKTGKPTAQIAKQRQEQVKLIKSQSEAIRELDVATKDGGLIDQSTGSGAGALVDMGARFVGKATPGALAIGKLKPIYDLVLKMVPRFEGPQSDKDTALYKEASGQLADPAVPNDQKKAAGREILRLMKARRGQFTLTDAQPTEVISTSPVDALLEKYK